MTYQIKRLQTGFVVDEIVDVAAKERNVIDQRMVRTLDNFPHFLPVVGHYSRYNDEYEYFNDHINEFTIPIFEQCGSNSVRELRYHPASFSTKEALLFVPGGLYDSWNGDIRLGQIQHYFGNRYDIYTLYYRLPCSVTPKQSISTVQDVHKAMTWLRQSYDKVVGFGDQPDLIY